MSSSDLIRGSLLLGVHIGGVLFAFNEMFLSTFFLTFIDPRIKSEDDRSWGEDDRSWGEDDTEGGSEDDRSWGEGDKVEPWVFGHCSKETEENKSSKSTWRGTLAVGKFTCIGARTAGQPLIP